MPHHGSAARPVALITGASQGIGRVTAIRLAQAGYDLGLTARSASRLAVTADGVSDAGARSVAVTGDVADPDDVTRIVHEVTTRLGTVDLLVNNAGYVGSYDRFTDSDPTDWWRVLQTNVRGPALFTQALLPNMVRRRHGHIINISSLQGSQSGGTSVAYSVSKAALMRFTDSVAAELSGSGVVLFDLSPGLVRTAMTDDRPDLDTIPDDDWLSPELAAAAVIALASGKYDDLHGRFVRATDDLDALLIRLAGDPGGRVLRLLPAGQDDPVTMV